MRDLSTLDFPEHCLQAVTRLSISRCSVTTVTFEDAAMLEGEELEIAGGCGEGR